MNSRESEFPATSIGRTAGIRLQQTVAAAHESHPLLSPPPPSSDHPSNTPQSSTSTPKYVPYTPRHRPQPTAATTGTTVHPPPSPQHHAVGFGGDATSKLQVMHLKAAAQNIGLDSGTLGWGMLERIVQENDATEEWAEVWTALTMHKATLLLPLESASANEKITADLVKDHVVLCDGPSRDNAQIVTLSGLRGVLNGESLTFRSTLHPTSKRFQDVLNPQTRPTALTALPPLPRPLPNPTGHPATYPTYTVPSYSSSLNLPPRPQPVAKPPLPPRPANRTPGSSSNTAPSSSSRLTNTFASLFGGNASKAAAAAAASASTASSGPPVSSSPTASLYSVDSATNATTQDTSTPIEVCAFTIDRRIVHKQLAKEMNKTLKNEIQSALASAGSLGVVPGWVAERVLEVTAPWFPFVKSTSGSAAVTSGTVGPAPTGTARRRLNVSSSSGTGGGGGAADAGLGLGGGNGYVVNSLEEAPEEVSERLQDFYAFLEQDMRVGGTPFVPRSKTRKNKEKKGSSEGESNGDDDDDDDEKEKEREEMEKRVNEKMESEVRVRDVMEAVETTITSLFYDRLFMPSTSDDASHDEALSSRVKALTNLDLSLRHLGIGVPSNVAEGDLNAVVKACGDMLSQLDSCHAPSDKATILVAAHKIVVDGLSRLPPIRLISENDPDPSLDIPPSDAIPTPSSSSASSPDNRAERELPAYEEPETARPFPKRPHSPLEPAVGDDGGLAGPPPPPSTSSGHSTTTNAPCGLSRTKQAPPALPLHQPSSAPTTASPSTTSASGANTTTTTTPPPTLHITPPPPKPTPVSGDVLLPLIIFSVLQSNPPHLVSHLLFTQRFRNQSVGGEEGYCLINLMAVVEFLENADFVGEFGLGGGTATPSSTADLTPIPLTRSPVTAATPLGPSSNTSSTTGGAGAGLRGRMEQQVDAIADSANKVISGVVDSSFGILRSFIPGSNANANANANAGTNNTSNMASGMGMGIGIGNALRNSRPGTPSLRQDSSGGLLGLDSSTNATTAAIANTNPTLQRKESGFSIASLAASLPIPGTGINISATRRSSRSRAGSNTYGTAGEFEEQEGGQQLVAVVGGLGKKRRASSVRSSRSRGGSVRSGYDGYRYEDESDDDEEEEESGSEEEGEDEDEDGASTRENRRGRRRLSSIAPETGEDDDDTDGSDHDQDQDSSEDHPDANGEDQDATIGTTSNNNAPADARSIQSFESMLKRSKKEQANARGRKGTGGGKTKTKTKALVASSRGNGISMSRKSLTDRLASTVTGKNKNSQSSPPTSRRSSLHVPVPIPAPIPVPNLIPGLAGGASGTSPTSSRPVSPIPITTGTNGRPLSRHRNSQPSTTSLPPPRRRFMECAAEDLRISEVSELLREYRKLVEGVRALGGFDD